MWLVLIYMWYCSFSKSLFCSLQKPNSCGGWAALSGKC